MKDFHNRDNDEWKELATFDDGYTAMHVFMAEKTGELDVTMINTDAESVRITMSPAEAKALARVISNAHKDLK